LARKFFAKYQLPAVAHRLVFWPVSFTMPKLNLTIGFEDYSASCNRIKKTSMLNEHGGFFILQNNNLLIN